MAQGNNKFVRSSYLQETKKHKNFVKSSNKIADMQ